jgi:hypothetical protein
MTSSDCCAVPWLPCRGVSCASSHASTLALGDRPRRRPPSHRAPSARSLMSLSLNQSLVCEPLARRPIYEAIEPCQGMVLDVAFVQAERKFVNVTVQTLRAGVMIDADQPALQYGKDAFDAVRRHVFANIFASAVIHRVVVVSREVNARVCAAFMRFG